VLDAWKSPHLKLSPACANAAIALLERLVQEVAAATGTTVQNNTIHGGAATVDKNYRFLVEPRYYNPVINQWKETAKRCQGKDVVSPQELWKLLQNLARQYPAARFEYNVMTLTNIMNVMVAIEPDPAQAPVTAQAFLDEILKQESSPSCQPNLFTYSTLLKAWAESGRADASDRMDAVMARVNAHAARGGEPINETIYHIWLRFWAEQGGDCIDKMEACVERLQTDGVVQLNTASWSQLVYGYAKARDLEKAAQVLDRMVAQHDPANNKDVRLLGESIQHIVMACRRALEDRMIPYKMRDDLLATTRNVVQKHARAELLGVAHLSTSVACLLGVRLYLYRYCNLCWLESHTFRLSCSNDFLLQGKCRGL